MNNSNRKMSFSEAGKLGAAASLEYQHKRKQNNMEAYKLNPSICKQCGAALDYKYRRNTFCSRSCAATYNNLHKENVRDWITTKCLNCNKVITRKVQSFYCNNKCQAEYKWKQTKQRIIEAGEFETHGGIVTKGETKRTQAYRFLEEEYGHKCAICGLSEWMGQPIPLIVDHIDGNSLNHKIENFRLVCGNCDMQLDTYKSKNKGKGRKYRRALYQTDKESELK